MRKCPACNGSFDVRKMAGIEIDLCKMCGGVFLDAGEAEAKGIETHVLFGVGPSAASAIGPSPRKCPEHLNPMMTFEVSRADGSSMQIERAICCGGIFLDAGEESGVREAARRAKSFSAGPRGGFVAPPWLDERAAKRDVMAGIVGGVGVDDEDDFVDDGVLRCARCKSELTVDKRNGIELDSCGECGSLFLDAGESQALGVDAIALLAGGEGAAVEVGPAPIRCPKHGKPMTTYVVESVLGRLEIEVAECGGIFLDGDEEDAFVRASRRAASYAADDEFQQKGEVVGTSAVAKGLVDSGVAAEAQGRIRTAMADLEREKEKRRRARHRRRRGLLEQWDDD